MAYVRALIFCCIALTTLNFSSGQLPSGFPQLPSLPGLDMTNLNASGSGFPQIPSFGFGFPQFPSFGSGFPMMPSFPSFFGGGRTRRDTEAEADNNEDHQDRFFFRFPSLTSCNTTTQGGRSCLNCRQALNCLANNHGLRTTCRGLLQYCDQGRCVFSRPSNCTS